MIFLLALRLGLASASAQTGGELTLARAVELAVANNLQARLARARDDAARARALQAASSLLPQLLGTVDQTRVLKVNLLAQGFPSNIPFFSPLLGPFNTFDARLRLTQNLLDTAALLRWRSGRAEAEAARQEELLAREQVATAAALAYVEALRAALSVEAAQADVDLAQSLLRLAQDQRKAGMSTGIDVARAQTRLEQERLRLIRSRLDARLSELRLKRVVGLPLSRAVTLQSALPAAGESLVPAEEPAVEQGLGGRLEIKVAEDLSRADRLNWRAAQASNLPVIKAAADYGFSGNLPASTARTGSFGGRLELPIFSGGALLGRSREAGARWRESEDRLADVRAQVEQDVRSAIETLSSETEEVRTAHQASELAQREMEMARDRFSAGAGDNIQVVEAAAALARARDEEIDALARYNVARANLAAALGRAGEFTL